MYAFKTDENGRINQMATPPEFLPDGILIDHLPDNYYDYLYVDRELVYDPIPMLSEEEKQSQCEAEEQKLQEQQAFLEDAPIRTSDTEQAIAELGVLFAELMDMVSAIK